MKNFKNLLLPQNNIDYLMRSYLRTYLPIIQRLGTETFHIINEILKQLVPKTPYDNLATKIKIHVVLTLLTFLS